jgi:uncharacterized protein (TIGR00369 family)
MTEPLDGLIQYLLNRYKNSSYANFLKMHILEIHDGEITVSMIVRHELTNLSHILHGGAVGSLLDMAMNLACFSTGSRVTILGFNTNFLRGCKEGKNVRAITRILHSGRRTIVVEGQVLDAEDNLLAKGRGTFLVTGRFTPEDLQGTAADVPVKQETPLDLETSRAAPPKTKRMTGRLRDLLLHVHDRNYFAKYLGMEIQQIGERHCLVAMPVTPKHINIRGVIHGGALVSLADMSMMLACASLGKHTLTLDLNINFVGRVREGTVVSSFSQVIHRGKTTMVVRSSIHDEGRRLLAEARGTFIVIGDYSLDDWD